jgi:O-antigen/teichoic acid export membrane protein
VVAAEEPVAAPPAAAVARAPARAPVAPPAAGIRILGPLLAAGLTIYLARRFGPVGYGVYVLALAIGASALYVGWVILPLLVRRLAGEEADLLDPERIAVRTGLGLRLACTALVAAGVFALAGPIAHGYGVTALTWPLRWVAVGVAGQALVWLLAGRALVTRASAFGGSITAVAQLAQAIDAAALVANGAGVAGAVVARLSGYVVSAAALFLFAGTGERRRPAAWDEARSRVADPNAVADADASWTAAAGIGAIVAAAVVGAAPLGRFGVALVFTLVLAYAGHELAGGPVLSRFAAARRVDAAAIARRLRFLARSQGAALAPLVIWADPLMHLLFGDRYGAGAGALRALAAAAFVAAPAWLATVAVTRLARVRDRLLAASVAIEAGVIAIYLLATADGIVGAAVGVDVLLALYLVAHLWVAAAMLDLELGALLRTVVRVAAAALAMAAVLYAIGTRDLTVIGWIAGAVGGAAAYLAVLLVTGELSVADMAHSRLAERSDEPRR